MAPGKFEDPLAALRRQVSRTRAHPPAPDKAQMRRQRSTPGERAQIPPTATRPPEQVRETPKNRKCAQGEHQRAEKHDHVPRNKNRKEQAKEQPDRNAFDPAHAQALRQHPHVHHENHPNQRNQMRLKVAARQHDLCISGTLTGSATGSLGSSTRCSYLSKEALLRIQIPVKLPLSIPETRIEKSGHAREQGTDVLPLPPRVVVPMNEGFEANPSSKTKYTRYEVKCMKGYRLHENHEVRSLHKKLTKQFHKLELDEDNIPGRGHGQHSRNRYLLGAHPRR